MGNDWRHSRAFVIQIGLGANPSAGRYEGRVEHVASGRTARFADADQLLRFIADTLTDQGVTDAPARWRSR
jgi:hypothetical protein